MDAITLGVDLATATARCVALDTGTGQSVATAQAPLPAPERSAGGVSRQRPDYASVAFAVIASVCRQLGPEARRVGALSLTGTSGTVVPCDAQGTPVADARLYDDSSSAAVASTVGLTGASSLGRMVSLQNEIRGNGGQRHTLMLATVDVVAAALVGAVVPCDTSHALKAGIDVQRREWPRDAMSALGLDTTALPDLMPPGQLLGMVATSAAAALGLPPGVQLVAGMTDGCTAQISAAAVHPGDTMGVLGTTLVVKGVSPGQVTSPDGAVYSHLSPSGDFWPGGASSTGAGVLDTEFAGRDLAGLDRAAADRGPSTLVRYPLARPGERFPVTDPALGSLRTGDPVDEVDAYRAVLEGVAFVERLAVETLRRLGVSTRRHTVTGGASRSATWNTLRATIVAPAMAPATGSGIGAPARGVVHAPAASSAVGAAVLAGHWLGRAGGSTDTLADTVDRLLPPPLPVVPDHTEADQLEQSYDVFLALLGPAYRPPPMTDIAEQSAERRPHHV